MVDKYFRCPVSNIQLQTAQFVFVRYKDFKRTKVPVFYRIPSLITTFTRHWTSLLATWINILTPSLLLLMSFSMYARLPNDLNPLNPELNPIWYLLALLAHHFLHVSRIRVKSLTLRLLMSYIYIYLYIYGAPILDVSRSHTTTQHSR